MGTTYGSECSPQEGLGPGGGRVCCGGVREIPGGEGSKAEQGAPANEAPLLEQSHPQFPGQLPRNRAHLGYDV